MDNKVLGLIIGAIIAAVLTILGVSYMVTNADDSIEPAPVTSSTPAPSDTSDPILDLLEETWNEQSYDDQQSLCWLFNMDSQRAFDAFNDGSEGLVPQETFDEFFSAECSTI